MAQSTQVRQILIKVDTKGDGELRKMAGELQRITKEVTSLAGISRTIQGFFAFQFAGIGIKNLTDTADTMQQLTDRITIFTGTQEQANLVIEDLGQVANRTKTSVDSLATIYTRLASATRSLNLSSAAVLNIVEALQNTFRLSGATTEEATSTIIQLSQSFSKGKLNGDELNSVMEQNAVIAEALRKEYGKDLYAKAKAGAIQVTDVLRVLFKEQEANAAAAAKLGQTFSQTVTVATNEFKIKLNELNQEFNLSGVFASVVEASMQKLGLAITAIAIVALPALISGLAALGKASYAFVVTPIGAAIAILATAAALIIYTFDSVEDLVNQLKIWGSYLLDFADILIKGPVYAFLKLHDVMLSLAGVSTDIANKFYDSGKIFGGYASSIRETVKEQEEFNKLQEEVAKQVEAEHRLLAQEEIINKLKNASAAAAPKAKELFAELNKGIDPENVRDVGAYFNELEKIEKLKLSEEWAKGKINLDQYNQKFNDLKKLQIARDFREGSISLEEFNQKIEQNKLDELKFKLDAGKISWQEYRREIDKTSTSLDPSSLLARGAGRYIESIGTLSNAIAGGIEKAFNSLEDSFSDFISKGTVDFKAFGASVLAEINKIIIRYGVIRPLAGAIESFFSGAGASVAGGISPNAPASAVGGSIAAPFAKMSGTFGSAEFASKAVGNYSSSAFESSAGLSSDSPVTVNIINNTGAEVVQQETTGPQGERLLDVVIQSKVKDAISGGAFDKTFNQNFGIKRRGN